MPRKKKEVITESIRTYFMLTRSKTLEVEENLLDVDDTAQNPVQSLTTKMASPKASKEDDVTNAELREILLKMDAKRTEEFAKLKDTMGELSEKVDGLEFEISKVKEVQATTEQNVNKVRDEVADLRGQLLHLQMHNRRYNLLIYGVPGHESTTEEATEVVRKFGVQSLQLGEEYVKTTSIRNAHRLQKRDNGPAPIIVKFLFWSEREAFLRAGKNLGGTKLSIRTDLPPTLKKKRADLARHAFELRTKEKLQTRIREKGTNVYLQVRDDKEDDWRDVNM